MSDSARPSPRESIIDFDIACIVAGSRHYDDYKKFSETMFGYLKKFGDKSIIFISGKASSGADDMVIKWCIENHLPWVEFPANWDKFGKSAGYIRNTEMASYGTHLIAFYDGKSPGTAHMLDTAKKHRLEIYPILISIKEDNHARYPAHDF